MNRSLLAHALFVASVCIAARAAAQAQAGLLGASCATDSDCGDEDASGLGCLRASAEFGERGPAGGLCTAPCTVHADCWSWDETAVCASQPGVCVEGCTRGSPRPDTWDPSKCHGRQDMACSASSRACTPRCARDDQCGVGLHCNPATGLCDPKRVTGDPPGTACDRFSGANPCAGVCLGICGELCTIGAAVTCGVSRFHSSLRAVCLGEIVASSVGDLGYCAELCNCSSDCPSDTVCAPWDFEGRFEAAGLCVAGTRPAGAHDCVNAPTDAATASSCAYGSVRACKTAACLGTASCLPNGEYGDCRCIPTPDAEDLDAGDDDASTSARDTGVSRDAAAGASRDSGGPKGADHASGCDCSVPRWPADRGVLALLGASMVLVTRRIHRKRARR